MRRAMLIGAAVLGAALTSGCGSMPTEARMSVFEVDRDKVAAVESAATRVGTRVYWVNPPLKPRH
jgi:outer membrane murein-binding lipoprotein Lpp